MIRLDMSDQNLSGNRNALERNFAQMSDLELLDIAAKPQELTTLANEILAQELTKRDLSIAEPSKAIPQAEPRRISGPLMMVKRFRDLPEALVAKSILDSAEIDSFLADENVVRIDWLYSNLIGGAKLMVRPEDLDEATKLLDQSANSELQADAEQKDVSNNTGETSE